MKAQWRVKRTLIQSSEGERRWDYAFQFLLSWVREAGSDELCSDPREENQDENCPVCSGINRSAAATAND